MNKTDAEIEKALECCFNRDFEDCKGCPLENEFDELFTCMNTRNRLTLDYINRLKAKEREQQAEIEILNHNLKCEKIHKEGLIERYKNVKDNLKAVLEERADHSEAIKEFAERLKSQFHISCDYTCNYVRAVINDLVKEMTENEGKE